VSIQSRGIATAEFNFDPGTLDEPSREDCATPRRPASKAGPDWLATAKLADLEDREMLP
jgi:hypothetical protein